MYISENRKANADNFYVVPGNANIKRAYDPRLTVIDGVVHMCFAVDSKHGIRGGIATTEDFEHFDIKSISVPENRNMVLFPEKIGGMYVRLERPFPVYSQRADHFDIWMSKSADLRYWGDAQLVLDWKSVPFCNEKIGPSDPPIKTEKGWLTTFHSVDIDMNREQASWGEKWHKRYCTGIMLLDLDDPSKIIGMSKVPLMVPETYYEVNEGFRGNVIFTTAMIPEDNGEVKIYYGAADTCVCLATASVDDLLKACLEN